MAQEIASAPARGANTSDTAKVKLPEHVMPRSLEELETGQKGVYFRVGDTSIVVGRLKEELAKLFPDAQIKTDDNHFDIQTQRLIQKEFKTVGSDGLIGPKVLAAIDKKLREQKLEPLLRNPTEADLKEIEKIGTKEQTLENAKALQSVINRIVDDPSKALSVTGHLGPQTLDAVNGLLKSSGCEPVKNVNHYAADFVKRLYEARNVPAVPQPPAPAPSPVEPAPKPKIPDAAEVNGEVELFSTYREFSHQPSSARTNQADTREKMRRNALWELEKMSAQPEMLGAVKEKYDSAHGTGAFVKDVDRLFDTGVLSFGKSKEEHERAIKLASGMSVEDVQLENLGKKFDKIFGDAKALDADALSECLELLRSNPSLGVKAGQLTLSDGSSVLDRVNESWDLLNKSQETRNNRADLTFKHAELFSYLLGQEQAAMYAAEAQRIAAAYQE